MMTLTKEERAAARMRRALTAFPPDAVKVLGELGDGEYVLPASNIARKIGVPAPRVREIHRALKTLGFAHVGTLMTDEGMVCGSGYWASARGEELRDGIASADTRPQDEDATQIAASLASGAVPAAERADAQPLPPSPPKGD